MKLTESVVWLSLLFLGSCSAFGDILEVPGEYPSIQFALDATLEGDTVKVAPGVYHELLFGPQHSLFMTGWYPCDTLPELRTLLDPVPSVGDTQSLVVFSGDSVSIRNFAFYNRPELHQYEFSTRSGGIEFLGRALRLDSCRFDSVSRAVNGGSVIYSSDCVFNKCAIQCIRPNTFGSLIAERCLFDGDTGIWLVRCYSGSSIRDCTFLCSSNHTDLLSVAGEHIEIRDCVFGPCFSAFPILRIYTQGECAVQNCVFDGVERASSLIEVSMECPGPEGEPIIIRDNVFRNYSSIPPAQGTPAIKLICQGSDNGEFGTVQGNHFVNGSGDPGVGVLIHGSVRISENTFQNLLPENSADIHAASSSLDTVIARDNRLLQPGLATSTVGTFLDARWNWWSDSSGPYHSNLNPSGMGTSVGNGVMFIPWLTSDPDSSDTTSVAPEHETSAELNSFRLTAFPNPFNNVVTLQLEVPVSEEYTLLLFDLTGREVQRLFQGAVNEMHEIGFDAGDLPSGVYFAQLRDDHATRVATKLLLLK